MKKVLLTLALVATASLSNAQVFRNNFLNGCKEGEPIEKAAYTAKKAPLNKDVWSAVFNEKAPYIGESPVAGKELSYNCLLYTSRCTWASLSPTVRDCK